MRDMLEYVMRGAFGSVNLTALNRDSGISLYRIRQAMRGNASLSFRQDFADYLWRKEQEMRSGAQKLAGLRVWLAGSAA